MKKIAPIILLFLFCGSDIPAQSKLTQDEYAAYGTVLKSIYEDNRETYSSRWEFVILNETKFDREVGLPSTKKYRALVKEFRQQNAASYAIERRFPAGAYSEKYYLLSQIEVDQLLEKGRTELKRIQTEGIYQLPPSEALISLFKKYPEASGLYTLSRVGFSGKLAMVQIKGDLGWNGFTRNYILKKSGREWQILSFSGSSWR